MAAVLVPLCLGMAIGQFAQMAYEADHNFGRISYALVTLLCIAALGAHIMEG